MSRFAVPTILTVALLLAGCVAARPAECPALVVPSEDNCRAICEKQWEHAVDEAIQEIGPVSESIGEIEVAPVVAEDVVILNHRMQPPQYGYVDIVGQVQNNGAAPVESVEIVASIYDASGAFLGSTFTFAEIDPLAPGEISPFEISLNVDEFPGMTKYELQIN